MELMIGRRAPSMELILGRRAPMELIETPNITPECRGGCIYVESMKFIVLRQKALINLLNKKTKVKVKFDHGEVVDFGVCQVTDIIQQERTTKIIVG